MRANNPADVHKLFLSCFSAGDLEGLVSLYEPEAVLTPLPGKIARGTSEIRPALQQFLSSKKHFEMEHPMVINAGDLAILYSSWQLTVSDENGKDVHMSGRTTDVVRRQSDGSWKYVIDNPYGEKP